MKRFFLCAVMAFFAISISAQELNIASFNLRNNSSADYAKHNGWNERRDILSAMINLEAFDVFGTQEGRKIQLEDIFEAMHRI